MISLKVDYKGETFSTDVSEAGTVLDLKKAISVAKSVPVIQQQLSYKPKAEGDKKTVVNDDSLPIKLLKLSPGESLVLKNLGSQMRWSSVFYIEYLGPIVVFALCYLMGDTNNYTQLQQLLFAMGILHFLKRQLETLFVHVFSRNSMPFRRALINMFHYWILFGLFVGIELFYFWKDPKYPSPVIAGLVVVWGISEFMNLMCHMELASFRKVPDKKKSEGDYLNPTKIRKIPKGWGFSLVSSANYFWQSMGWISFSILSRCYTSYFFTVCSIYQMLDWAVKKHKEYRKQFPDYPKNRKAMFPFII